MAFEKVDIDPAADEKPKATKPADGEKAKKENKPKEDAKPRKTQASSKPGPKTLEAKLGEFLAGAGMIVTMTGDLHCGFILSARGEALAHAWAELAKTNKHVNQFLTKLVEGGAWGGVIWTTASVAVPIAQHHGIYPANMPNPWGIMDMNPEDLAAQMQAVGMPVTEDMLRPQPASNGTGTTPPVPPVG